MQDINVFCKCISKDHVFKILTNFILFIIIFLYFFYICCYKEIQLKLNDIMTEFLIKPNIFPIFNYMYARIISFIYVFLCIETCKFFKMNVIPLSTRVHPPSKKA